MKYYLKAERMIRHTPYLKLNLKANTVVFDKKECGENYQNTFTEEEIARLPKWCQELTRELVDEKKSCYFCKPEYGRFISSELVMINSFHRVEECGKIELKVENKPEVKDYWQGLLSEGEEYDV